MKLRVEAEVKPTEAWEKVEAAIKKIFPTLELVRAENSIFGESTRVEELARLHQLLRQHAILDSARSTMIRGKREKVVRFMLNKQAAFASKISFTDGESPLGPIVVTLEAPDIERLIDYLAPRTEAGKPIMEISYG